MNKRTIDALADYFTGAAVAHNSVCLGLPAPHNAMARKFFDCRAALGLRFYESKDEAIKIITERLIES